MRFQLTLLVGVLVASSAVGCSSSLDDGAADAGSAKRPADSIGPRRRPIRSDGPTNLGGEGRAGRGVRSRRRSPANALSSPTSTRNRSVSIPPT